MIGKTIAELTPGDRAEMTRVVARAVAMATQAARLWAALVTSAVRR